MKTTTDVPRTDRALGYLLVLVISILSTLALIHWMSCSQEAGTALCMAMAVTPTRTGWLARAWDALKLWRLRAALRNELGALESMEQAAEDLPELIEYQKRRVEYWRQRLSLALGTPVDRL